MRNYSERRWIAAGLAVILLVATPLAALAQDAPSSEPSPEKLLREMSEELKSAKNFSFHAEINFDDVLISGQKLQYAGAVDVTVRRPNGLYVDYRDDVSAKRFWYDGKAGTLLDVVQAKYSQADLPGEIDAAMDQLQKRYDLTLPLANLISSDLFEMIDEHVLAWGYIGVHDVEGAPAHHLAITGQNADLQVWIQKDGRPVPLKFVVTYKNSPSAPQYEAVLMDWDLEAKVAANTFASALPEGAQKIEFLVVEGSK